LPIGVRNKGENSRLCHYCRCNSVKYYLESLGAKDEFIFTTDLFVMNKSIIKAIIYVNIPEKYKLHIIIPDDSWILALNNLLYKTITIFVNSESANKSDMIIETINNEIQLMINKIDEAIENNKYLKYYFVIKIRGIEI